MESKGGRRDKAVGGIMWDAVRETPDYRLTASFQTLLEHIQHNLQYNEMA